MKNKDLIIIPLWLREKGSTMDSPPSLVLGNVTLPSGRKADISLADGRVIHTGAPRTVTSAYLDCRDLLFVPAAIDMHVHMRGGSQSAKEDWRSGGMSALAGGVTVVVDQPNTVPPISNPQVLNDRVGEARKNSFCNFAINCSVTKETRLEEMWKAGAMAFTLRVGENLWNYLPRIARTIRIPPSMMLNSWMGTDFTNDDLVKESSLRKDFAARVDRRADDPPGWWLVLEVKPGIVGRWARIEMLVSDERLPVEERHFDPKGRLARTMRFDEVKVLGGRRLPAHLVLVPTDAEGQRTEMRYLEVQFDVKVPDDTFSLSRLEQSR